MANVIVRNLDDDVAHALKARARANSRSLEAELRVILTNAARPGRPEDLVALADRIAVMARRAASSEAAGRLREDSASP